jgi:hypothetical protein
MTSQTRSLARFTFRAVTLPVAGLLSLATLTACVPLSESAPGTTPTPTRTGTPALSEPAALPEKTTPVEATPEPDAGCPVTAEELVKALRNPPDGDRWKDGPKTLEKVKCVDGFAVGHTPYTGANQPAWILFGFDDTTRQWRVLNVGSANYCEGYVPDDVAAQLPGCQVDVP